MGLAFCPGALRGCGCGLDRRTRRSVTVSRVLPRSGQGCGAFRRYAEHERTKPSHASAGTGPSGTSLLRRLAPNSSRAGRTSGIATASRLPHAQSSVAHTLRNGMSTSGPKIRGRASLCRNRPSPGLRRKVPHGTPRPIKRRAGFEYVLSEATHAIAFPAPPVVSFRVNHILHGL